MLADVEGIQPKVKGVSVGGVYTSLYLPTYRVGLDVGIASRAMTGVETLLLSHAHVDHSGALLTLLGIRALNGREDPLRIVLPAAVASTMREIIDKAASFQRRPFAVEWFPMEAGDRLCIRGNLWVKALRAYHTAPCLAYLFYRNVQKLRAEFQGMSAKEIAALRQRGEVLSREESRIEFAYATDTLSQILDREPELYRAPTLILESTFLDERKSVDETRSKGHIHLDEILERAEHFSNAQLLLMHFSQSYSAREIRRIVAERCASMQPRVLPLLPATGEWPR